MGHDAMTQSELASFDSPQRNTMLTTRIQMLCRFSYGLASVSLCPILETALFLNALVFMPLSRTKKERKFIDVSIHLFAAGILVIFT